MAHCHRVLGVRALTPFDLRLGLGGVGGSWWGCLAHSVLRGIWGVALVFVWGCAQLGGGGGSLFFGNFLLVLAALVLAGHWALGWHSVGFRHFPDIS